MAHFAIEGAVAFVTGTNKKNGIGRAIVEALLAAGAKKVYATARDRNQLTDLLAAHPGRVEAVQLDVGDRTALAGLGAVYPDVDLVVNNAGVMQGSGSLDDVAAAEREVAVNYLAPLAITRSFAPVFGKRVRPSDTDRRGSALVNINSIASLVNFPLGGTYSASKAASHSLTQAQRRDLPDTLVVGVYPGPIDTSMAERVPLDKAPPSAVAAAVIHALRSGTEDVFPDPTAQQLHAGWQADAKALERQMSA